MFLMHYVCEVATLLLVLLMPPVKVLVFEQFVKYITNFVLDNVSFEEHALR